MTGEMNILHLDHTRASGGAEIALKRTIQIGTPWKAVIAVPRGTAAAIDDAFACVDGAALHVVEIGPAQQHGASSASKIKAVKFAFGIIGQAVALRASAEFRNASVIHANTSRSGLYGALACLVSRKPFVVHLRDIVDEASLGALGKRLFESLVLARADGVIGNSQASLRSAISSIKPSALTAVIPSPAGVVKRNPPKPIRQDVKKIGMVARIDPWKGQQLLIEAFADVFADSDVVLAFAGGPAFGHEGYFDEIKKLAAELGLQNRIEFRGHIDNVEEFNEAMDICVHASIRPEPLGQNILQYLAAGKPIIAANEGGPTEWITDGANGLLFRARDRKSLAAQLSKLASDDGLRSKLAAGTQNVRRVLSDEAVMELHAEFFDDVVKYRLSKR